VQAPVVVQAPAPAPVVQAPAPAGSSPWAPPLGEPGPMTPAVQAMQAAAPAIGAVARQEPAAPVMPAPAVVPQPASPKVSQNIPATTSMGGGKKKQDAKEKKASKGKFRETMWFKKGDLDAAAAEAAAQNPEASGGQDKADSLPVEDRYGDDGTLTTTDQARYSLKTGNTGAMPAMRDGSASGSVSERELIGEMKGGSRTLMIVGAVVALLLIGAILAFVL
jgi:hypothetical protein